MSHAAAQLLIRAGVPARYVELYPSPEAWLEARLSTPQLGASDIARIRGIIPTTWGSEWDVYTRCRDLVAGKARPKPEQTQAQHRGHVLERPALELFQAHTGCTVRPCTNSPIIVRDPDFPWMACSPDAIGVDGSRVFGIEVKTGSDTGAWGDPGDIPCPVPEGYAWPVPPYYATQVYWTMSLCRMPWVLVWLAPWYQVRAWTFSERDLLIEHELRTHASTWWSRHVVGGLAPEVDGSKACGEWVARVPETGLGPARPATKEEQALLVRYAQLRAQHQDLGRVLPELENRILDLAGPVEALQVGKTPVKINRQASRWAPRFGALDFLAQLPLETP